MVFPRCPSQTIEEQLCRQTEGCLQVNERCESYNLSFDCLFPSLLEANVRGEFQKKLKKQQKVESKWNHVWEKKKKQLNVVQIHLLLILKGNVLLNVHNIRMGKDMKRVLRLLCLC